MHVSSLASHRVAQWQYNRIKVSIFHPKDVYIDFRWPYAAHFFDEPDFQKLHCLRGTVYFTLNLASVLKMFCLLGVHYLKTNKKACAKRLSSIEKQCIIEDLPYRLPYNTQTKIKPEGSRLVRLMNKISWKAYICLNVRSNKKTFFSLVNVVL